MPSRDDRFSGPQPGIRVRAAREERALRILMVDDGAVIAGTVQSQLENSGYDVLIAKDAQMALHLQRRERPDLVLVDLIPWNADRTEIGRDAAAKADLAAMPLITPTVCSDQIARDGPGVLIWIQVFANAAHFSVPTDSP